MILRARADALASAGFDLGEEELRAMSGMHSSDVYGGIADRLGKPMPADIRERFRIAFRTRIERGLPPIDGVRELIESLRVPFCIASNGSYAFMEMTLAAAGLSEIVAGRIVSADDVARPKPFPDLFLLAAHRFDAYPAGCLVVEDSIPGVTAAGAAGMKVFGFAGAQHCGPDHADALLAAGASAVCATMAELSARLRGHGLAAAAPT